MKNFFHAFFATFSKKWHFITEAMLLDVSRTTCSAVYRELRWRARVCIVVNHAFLSRSSVSGVFQNGVVNAATRVPSKTV